LLFDLKPTSFPCVHSLKTYHGMVRYWPYLYSTACFQSLECKEVCPRNNGRAFPRLFGLLHNRITVIMVSAIQRIIGINYRIQNASKGVEYRGAGFG
jgi:hypothetical protein